MNATTIFQLVILLPVVAYCNSFPLSTNSRWIVDQKSGNRVKLACANWASHLEPMVPEGLDKKPISYIASQISGRGFNCVRFTWATFMFTRANYSSLTVSQSLDKFKLTAAKTGIAKNNPSFFNMTVVDVHKAVVDALGRNRLMVVLDNHVSRPTWCCNSNDGNGFFGEAHFDPSEWLRGLVAVARAYKGHPSVVGMSLRNELRGNKQNEDDWYKYMQQGAEAVHKESPDFLVIVSGLSFDTNLGFLKNRPFKADVGNKLVFEGHWYSFGTPADQWAQKTNSLCGRHAQGVENNILFLTRGKPAFPIILSEFGADQRGANEADNRYITCLLAKVAETDVDWALWAFQGSYILREGKVNLDEVYGVMDLNWDGPRNAPYLLDRLEFVRQIIQVPSKSSKPTSYILFHPQSGQCVQVGRSGIILGKCTTKASKWEHDKEGEPIKLAGSGQCLGVAGTGSPARVSADCSGGGTKWKYVSASGLHLAAQDEQGKYLCLERNARDSTVVTRKCLCVGDDLGDFPTCNENPQVQWFKLVPTNVM